MTRSQLFYTVIGPYPGGFGTIAAFSTYDEAYGYVKGTNLFMGIPRTADELEELGVPVPLDLTDSERDPLLGKAA